ncbi:ATP-binding cassette domain-containing protein [Adhaeribacter radiodurans]|uniref:ATP-binding cassette domain-containing protein n=1 Tax=Adhaeribacter radiodurans TaxID=2745197 RepID=A0A7L7L6B8_9BACT|nr:ATP-binding cassette domain-containing protein [Adhaeribacter radiodurans]QMU28294.1 ATP-binding cassette domain-containing protein [Adhaeribacter radiodurans]
MNSSDKNLAGSLQLFLEHASFIRQNQIVFSDINWHLQPDEQWAIYGPVGAGKTTFLSALAGQLPLRSGKFELQVRSAENASFQVIDRSAYRSQTALVTFQQQNSFFNYSRAFYQQRYQSLESELAIPTVNDLLTAAASHCSPAELEQITDLLQLKDLLPFELIKLSNGQTRKLQIARALLQKPKLLILDNPFTGLDVESRQHLKEIINELIQQGTQVLLASNQPDLPEKISRVLWLEDFKMKSQYSRAEFYEVLRKKEPAQPLKETSLDSGDLIKMPKPGKDFQIAVQMNKVRVQYQQNVILDNITWTVRKGEKWALVGPNGSGKTTLLSLIYADNPQAFANKIVLFDHRKGSGESIWDIKKRIGFVSPELHLYFRQPLTGNEVAATGFTDTLTRPRQLTDVQSQLIQEHFSFFNRLDLLNKPFLQLSAGEQRLVLLIRSLVKNPDLIIWDEPFQGLSPEYTEMATDLLSIYCDNGTTLILVSHYDHEIPDFVPNYLYLEQGRIKRMINS